MAIGQIKLYQGDEINLPSSGQLNELFFTSNGKIFKGTGSSLIEYSKYVVTTTDLSLISSPAQDNIYIDTTNWTVNAWNGTQWKVLGGSVTPTSTDTFTNKTIDATLNTISNLDTTNFKSSAISTSVPSTGAVDTKFTTEKAVSDIINTIGTKIDGVIKDVSYDSTTQTWTFTKEDNTTIQINHILDSLIKQVAYDSTTKKLKFTFDGDPTPSPVEIDISDLIDVYTVSDTNTVDLTLAGNNIKADVKISTTADNIITSDSTGIYASLDWKTF